MAAQRAGRRIDLEAAEARGPVRIAAAQTASADNQMKQGASSSLLKSLEARVGIEPAYADLQSAA